MAWIIKYEERAKKELKKLGRNAQRDILDYFDERIATAKDPRQFGAPLRFDLSGYWKYRIGDYRAICKIQDKEITVLILHVGHRKEVYDIKG